MVSVQFVRRLAGVIVMLTAAPGWALVKDKADPACRALAPPAVHPKGAGGFLRPIEARDLIELRDTGLVNAPIAGNQPMTVSPDGRRFAFHLRKASIADDRYCQGVFVMDARRGARPRLLTSGGEFMRETISIAGITEFPSGTPSPVTPRWSPDGRWILYLRRDDSITQVWRVPADGGVAEPVTRSPVDVKDADWTASGDIVLSSRAGLIAFRQAVAREAPGGHLYDERFFPTGDSQPHPLAAMPLDYQVIDPATAVLRRATTEEAAVLVDRPTVRDPRPLLRAESGRGRVAWTERIEAQRSYGPTRLEVRIAGRAVFCRPGDCPGDIVGLWWLKDDDLLFLSALGKERGEIGLYRWTPGKGAPRRLLVTRDRLIGCMTIARPELLCAYESTTRPRHFVLLDPANGRIEPLLDLNPELSSVRMSSVNRLYFKTRDGFASYADLALPPDHKAGQRHPLIVTQYLSQGFLRGSTGDENPIQLFAARGYAVLNFQRPLGHLAPGDALLAKKASNDNLWDRRNVQAAIEAGIATAIDLGVIDSMRVGITGLSDGAATAWYGLINSRLFAAAALSGCCDEPGWGDGRLGLGYARMIRDIGYPGVGDPGFDSFWQAYALKLNTSKPSVPLLIQTSDWEMRLATDSFYALRRAGWPVEMFVFDDEYHLKTGPKHLAAIYRRTLHWFDYWLRGLRDPDPQWHDQYARWDTLPRPARAPGKAQDQN